MSRKATAALLMVSAAALFVAAFWVARATMLKSQSAAFRPYIATVAESLYKGASDKPFQTTYWVEAMRDDGSEATARRVQAPDHNWYEERTILDLTDGKRISIDPITKSVTTYPLTARATSFYMASRTECARAAGIQAANILGYNAVEIAFGATQEFGRPGRKVVSHEWEAPALGCLRLDQDVTFLDPQSGAVLGRRTVRVLTVTEGEPSAALFTIPVNYIERSPSEVFSIFDSRFHKPDHPKTDDLLDRVYQTAQAHGH